MRRIAAVVEKTCLGQIRDRRLAVPRDALVVLLLGLRNVYVQRPLQLLVGFSQPAAKRLVGQIFGMDAEVGSNEGRGMRGEG